MPLQATSGAASYDAFGGGVAAVPNYIEDVFSTYLYTGNGSTQTITNGIDLAGKGGLVWTKRRVNTGGIGDTYHILTDTVRGANKQLYSNGTDAQATNSNMITSFNAGGYSIGSDGNVNFSNASPQTYVSWTFRKQPKFFDVVTYTGTGSARTVAHNLGSVPGCIIVKRTDSAGTNWVVYHRSLGNSTVISLNTTDASGTSTIWNTTSPTSTEFSVSGLGAVNTSGGTYVAYLFAHNAGGFGLTGTDNVISCGSYAGNGLSDGPTINLGYEPQWLLVKNITAVRDWFLMDNMRGFTASGTDALLNPNLSSAETSGTKIGVTATGFQCLSASGDTNQNSATYIYIAIRRGPMKVPTSGTSVFSPVTATAPSSPYTVTTNFPVDLTINSLKNTSSGKNFNDRLRGGTTTSYVALDSTGTAAEATGTGFGIGFDSNTSIIDNGWESGTGNNAIWWNFRRAPSFFDEVCYTGTGSARTISHNLGVAPELMIVKSRSLSSGGYWWVYSASLLASEYLELDGTYAKNTATTMWNDTRPTSSVFSVGTVTGVNASGNNFVAYLFASCAGVSKVGSYTGNGSSQTINCGFTGGARFVLIKRTDSTGDWYVWDSARGIVAGNDPYLLLNSTAAEVTNTDYVDTYSAGFEISSTAPAAINASGGTFIFLAIA